MNRLEHEFNLKCVFIMFDANLQIPDLRTWFRGHFSCIIRILVKNNQILQPESKTQETLLLNITNKVFIGLYSQATVGRNKDKKHRL